MSPHQGWLHFSQPRQLKLFMSSNFNFDLTKYDLDKQLNPHSLKNEISLGWFYYCQTPVQVEVKTRSWPYFPPVTMTMTMTTITITLIKRSQESVRSRSQGSESEVTIWRYLTLIFGLSRQQSRSLKVYIKVQSKSLSLTLAPPGLF